ncbi:hypothetical protein Tco_1040961 [Tanacetum coccineum]|uniref:Uncharacterized protein n=1 Tax=Tanacetum coccineum TaxID=301880 RepID=A0ABQ5GEU3_9ASTR
MKTEPDAPAAVNPQPDAPFGAYHQPDTPVVAVTIPNAPSVVVVYETKRTIVAVLLLNQRTLVGRCCNGGGGVDEVVTMMSEGWFDCDGSEDGGRDDDGGAFTWRGCRGSTAGERGEMVRVRASGYGDRVDRVMRRRLGLGQKNSPEKLFRRRPTVAGGGGGVAGLFGRESVFISFNGVFGITYLIKLYQSGSAPDPNSSDLTSSITNGGGYCSLSLCSAPRQSRDCKDLQWQK